jgi:hypothetical protein
MKRFSPFLLCRVNHASDRVPRSSLPAAVCLIVSASFVAFIAAGCGDDESARRVDPPVRVAATESRPAGGPQMGPAHHAGGSPTTAKVVKTGPFEKTFDGIRFSVPAGWNEVENPTPEFVDARFQIPTPHGEVKLTFSSNSGGADVNLERWIGQFQLPPGKRPVIEDLNVDKTSAKWVDLHGQFVGGAMAAGPASSGPIERMLGVAIPLGPRDFYLKLTGTEAAVADVRDAFREFVRTARISSGGSSGK